MEAITADHQNLTIDELLYDWPATKFEAFYSAFAKRKIADELALRRSLEQAALWGNMNYDSKEEPEVRANIQQEIDKMFSNAIAKLYGAPSPEDEVDIDEDDPFFKAMEVGKKRYGLEDGG